MKKIYLTFNGAIIIAATLLAGLAAPAVFAETASITARAKICKIPFGYLFFGRAMHNRGNHTGWYKNCTKDSTDPIISDISVDHPTATSVQIAWQTNEKATTEVVYGTDADNLDKNAITRDYLQTEHGVTLRRLDEDTKYYYRIIATDFWGNQSKSSVASFRTASNGAKDDPVISEIGISRTMSQVTISFVTNEPTTAVVAYGTTDSYGKISDRDSLDTKHSITLGGLASETQYHYRITVRDVDENTDTSADRTFTTRAGTSDDTLDPNISDIRISAVAATQVTLSWKTDEPATTEIVYSREDSGSDHTIIDESLATNHVVTLTNLSMKSEYEYRIIAEDGSGNTARESGSFMTQGDYQYSVFHKFFNYDRGDDRGHDDRKDDDKRR